jgi:hypothetical protein
MGLKPQTNSTTTFPAILKSPKEPKPEVTTMIKRIVASITVLMILLCGFALAETTSHKESAAIAAAEAWLKLVDEGKYTDSWRQAAEYLKAAVKQDQWEQSMQAFRQPLEGTVSRTLKSKNYATSLPGAPDGEYVVIQYETSFKNKKFAIETITPMLDQDGKWRVSGYYIK